MRVLKAPDYAKALGILLVVFGHVLRGLINAKIIDPTPFWEAVDRGIYLFHMPLFFYLAGLFFENTFVRYGYKKMLLRNIEIYLVPLVAWSYIQFSIQYFFSGYANVKLSFIDVLLSPFPPKQQFWFLGVLFFVVLITGLLMHLRNSRYLLWGAMIAFFILPMLQPELQKTLLIEFDFPYFRRLLFQFIVHLPFFIMGILIGSEKLKSIKINFAIIVFIFILAIWGEQKFGEIVPGFSVLASIICVLSYYKFFMWFDDVNFIDNAFSRVCLFIGANSMIIYLAHVICAALFRAVLIKLHIKDPLLHIFLGTSAGVIVPLLFVPIVFRMNSYFPRLVAIIFPVRLSRKT